MSQINQHFRLFHCPNKPLKNELFQFFFFIYPVLSDKAHIKDVIVKEKVKVSLCLKCYILLNHATYRPYFVYLTKIEKSRLVSA